MAEKKVPVSCGAVLSDQTSIGASTIILESFCVIFCDSCFVTAIGNGTGIKYHDVTMSKQNPLQYQELR